MPDYPITRYGARAGGDHLCTASIQGAIDAAHAAGGGRVVVDGGDYLTGTIQLRSRVTLEIAGGSRLVGSPRLEDYALPLEWGHHNDITPWHLVQAVEAEEIAITGAGAIAGNNHAFWKPDRAHAWAFWRENLRRVSPMIELQRCRGVRVENVTLTESPGWTLHLHDCVHVRIAGIRIRNPYFGPNADGIDITGGDSIAISDCDIATGDDAIALKTSEYSGPVTNVAITNCVLRTSCVGVRIGYESRRDFRDIVISNCVIPRCSRAFDLRSIKGAAIERVRISNITASTNSGWPVNRAFEIVNLRCPNVFKKSLHPDHPDHGKEKPLVQFGRVGDITLRGIDIVTDGRATVVGQPDAPVEDIRIEDVRFHYPMVDDPDPAMAGAQSWGFLPGDHADARTARAAFVLKGARRVVLRDVEVRWPSGPAPEGWHLLEPENANRGINAAYFAAHLDAIRAGEYVPPFHAVWARGVEDLRIEGGRLPASDPSVEPVRVVG